MALESLHLSRGSGPEIIVAIDSTRRGPALGGCRWKPYPDAASARREAAGLAAAMTRKAALARLRLGGGKAVVNASPRTRTRADLLAFGEFVDCLGGRYVTAADMGTNAEDMAVIAERTAHVVGLPARLGGCGDPAPFTALGVRLAMEAALDARSLALRGARVAVQGAGNVGGELVRLLLDSGARVVAADPSRPALDALPQSVEIVAPEEILAVECDLLAPCGPAGAIDRALAARLRCGIVCGAANDPLASRDVAGALAERGILFVPDYIANAGGLIHLALARDGGNASDSRAALQVIPENVNACLAAAKSAGIDPYAASELLAQSALDAGARTSPRRAARPRTRSRSRRARTGRRA
jgi:glutamate dehydrogenase/leucine dehydrogenase